MSLRAVGFQLRDWNFLNFLSGNFKKVMVELKGKYDHSLNELYKVPKDLPVIDFSKIKSQAHDVQFVEKLEKMYKERKTERPISSDDLNSTDVIRKRLMYKHIEEKSIEKLSVLEVSMLKNDIVYTVAELCLTPALKDQDIRLNKHYKGTIKDYDDFRIEWRNMLPKTNERAYEVVNKGLEYTSPYYF